MGLGNEAKWEYFRLMYEQYEKAARTARAALLDEFCATSGCNRNYTVRLLNGPRSDKPQVWAASGYPRSVQLKALPPSWMPWIRKPCRLNAKLEQQLRATDGLW